MKERLAAMEVRPCEEYVSALKVSSIMFLPIAKEKSGWRYKQKGSLALGTPCGILSCSE